MGILKKRTPSWKAWNKPSRRKRRSKKHSIGSILWEFVGILTIIVVVSIFVFGDSYQVPASNDHSGKRLELFTHGGDQTSHGSDLTFRQDDQMAAGADQDLSKRPYTEVVMNLNSTY